MALILSIALFAVFVANVFYGSMTGNPVLTDVQEMLLLFAASICFVIAILKRERDAKNAENE